MYYEHVYTVDVSGRIKKCKCFILQVCYSRENKSRKLNNSSLYRIILDITFKMCLLVLHKYFRQLILLLLLIIMTYLHTAYHVPDHVPRVSYVLIHFIFTLNAAMRICLKDFQLKGARLTEGLAVGLWNPSPNFPASD